jgi:cyclase
MKIRVIPTILTDGLTVVKGEKFNNWRTVGSAEATARLYASREVDELMFLDVTARKRNTTIDLKLLNQFSQLLNVPFSVGGGINSLEDARRCFREGAEKIVLGSAAVRNPSLISQISDVFGNQAVLVAIDFACDEKDEIRIESGKIELNIDAMQFIGQLEELGAGEILVQSIQRDGTLSGMDFQKITRVASVTKLPIIASGGAATPDDFLKCVSAGANAIAAGAIFQFTEYTPTYIRKYLRSNQVSTRVT